MTRALITGASGGIGEAFARKLARGGCDVVLVARTEDRLRSISRDLNTSFGIDASYFAVDLTESGAVDLVFESTEGRGVEIDMLINNAGFGSMGDFAELSLERELEMIDLNISALVAMTHRFLVKMRDRGSGTIVNVSSTAGEQPIPFFATYAATKAFVTSFTEAIAEENRPFGIHVMALCPGATATGFFDASGILDPLTVKGVHSPEAVVDHAMRALERGRRKATVGWVNYLVASLVNVLPNSLITRVMARPLRKRSQQPDL